MLLERKAMDSFKLLKHQSSRKVFVELSVPRCMFKVELRVVCWRGKVKEEEHIFF